MYQNFRKKDENIMKINLAISLNIIELNNKSFLMDLFISSNVSNCLLSPAAFSYEQFKNYK